MRRIVSGRTRRSLRWKACIEEKARTRVTAIEITHTARPSSWGCRFLLILHSVRIIWLRQRMHIEHSMGSTITAPDLRVTIPRCRSAPAAGGWSPRRRRRSSSTASINWWARTPRSDHDSEYRLAARSSNELLAPTANAAVSSHRMCIHSCCCNESVNPLRESACEFDVTAFVTTSSFCLNSRDSGPNCATHIGCHGQRWV